MATAIRVVATVALAHISFAGYRVFTDSPARGDAATGLGVLLLFILAVVAFTQQHAQPI